MAFDEVAGISFKDKDGVQIMKDAIDGDGSPWSYMCASIFGREISEFGAMWHGCDWDTHRILDADPWNDDQQDRKGDMLEPMAPAAKWEWLQPRPADWRPQVVHNAATLRSSLNREAVKHCTTMMGLLVPTVLLVWIEYGADEDWGILCYLLHGPTSSTGLTADDWAAWPTMETIHDSGRTRMLGVSNFQIEQLQQLWQKARVRPRFVQNRCYASLGWDRQVREFCRAHDMVYQGFSLLTANRETLAAAQMAQIATRHRRTIPQIVFRFAIQVGMIPLTGPPTPNAHGRT